MAGQPPILPILGASQRLLNTIAALDDSTCEVLETIVAGLSSKWEEKIAPDTDIVAPEFAKNFKTRLQLHHATHEEVFKKKTFEFAFKAACIVSGKKAEMDENVTNPGYDVLVDQVRYSLKTEAGSHLNETHIKISKLMEARWIRDCRTGADFHAGMKRILKHFTHYDRVLILRAFRITDPFEGVRYDLLEIPLDLLKLLKTLKPTDFSLRKKDSGTSTAEVKSGGLTAFRIRLDGSVEKVTIERLPVSECRRHATWTVETLLKKSEED